MRRGCFCPFICDLKRLRLGWGIALFLTGCASLPQVEEIRANAVFPGVPVESLRAGRNLYVNKCGGCHLLHLPSEFRKSEWSEKIIPEMSVEAKITAEESQLLLRYVLLFAKDTDFVKEK